MSPDRRVSATTQSESAASQATVVSRRVEIGGLPYVIRTTARHLSIEYTAHDPDWEYKKDRARGEVTEVHPYRQNDGDLASVGVTRSFANPERLNLVRVESHAQILPSGDPYSKENEVRAHLMRELLEDAEREGWTVTAMPSLDEAAKKWLQTSGFAALLS